jgi:hypothetical protein
MSLNKVSPLTITASPFRLLSAATTNSTLVQGKPCALQSIIASNTGTIAFLKFYDKVTAPTVGTDTPIWTVVVPASGQVSISLPAGVKFASGLGIGITGLVADNDATAVASNQVIVNLSFV